VSALPDRAANDLLSHVGERLSVRIQSEEGHTDDLVGILLPTGQLETKSGLKSFDIAKVVAWRVVLAPRGTGTPASQRVLDIELASSELWSGSEHLRTARWLLRAADGYTRRANSMVPSAPPWESALWTESSIDDDIAEADRFYQSRSLPTIISLPIPLFNDVASSLYERGWKSNLDLSVMVRVSRDKVITENTFSDIQSATTPSTEWITAHGRELGSQGEQVLLSGNPLFLSYAKSEEVVGIARVGFAQSWSALGALRVNSDLRRQGIARALVECAINSANERGYPFMFLQVDRHNQPAIALYESLGFAEHHRNIYLSRE
jgi:ribosomal protein S18 acetylase RimI-like enzyme